MKIAIIGTHSTGKTTLIEHVRDTFVEKGLTVETLPEYARLCPLPINEQTTLEAQKWILLHQITEEVAIEHAHKVVVTDRATLDNFAYMWRVANDEGRRVDHFERAAAEHMATYDAVFKTSLLPLDAKKDGVRSTDKEFRHMMDRLITLMLKKHAVPFFQLPETYEYDVHVNFILDAVQSQLSTIPTQNTVNLRLAV